MIALALHRALLQLGFFLKVMTYAILLISPGPWLQAKMQQPIGVVSLVIIHVNGLHESQDHLCFPLFLATEINYKI